MADLGMSVAIGRDELSLAQLEVNDHVNYYVANQFLQGQVSWNRNQVSSPFLDGAVTTFRTRQMVSEQVTIEVLGGQHDTRTQLYANITSLVQAVCQDNWALIVNIGGNTTQYQCEAADYQVNWDGPRMIANQIQVTLSIPRQPVPTVGGF